VRNENANLPEPLPWHRRHAMQIAMQLPEDFDDAVAVLRATESLLAFLRNDQDLGVRAPLDCERDGVGTVVMFPKAEPSSR
jgi:hypothetical protein